MRQVISQANTGLQLYSEMRLSRQFQACLFNFFYEKISHAQKHSQANINQQNKVKQILNNKGNNFPCAQTFKRVKVACFAFWCFLYARNVFVKKYIYIIIISLEIVLITSFQYTPDVYPYQPIYRASVYMHLFLFVTICENLFESFFICDHHLLESIF